MFTLLLPLLGLFISGSEGMKVTRRKRDSIKKKKRSQRKNSHSLSFHKTSWLPGSPVNRLDGDARRGAGSAGSCLWVQGKNVGWVTS